MRTVLVAGAAGGAGEGVARALLADRGTHVLAISRTAARLEELRERLDPGVRDRLTPIVGDAGDFSGAEQVVAKAQLVGSIDAAVAILGRGFWSGGPLLEVTPHDWREVLHEMLSAHFAFARAVVPLLAGRPESVYLSLGGSAAFAPVKDAGLMSIAAAGQAMLTRVLARERGSAPPRICELVIEGALNTRESRAFADPNWITADEAGSVVADLILRGTTAWQPLTREGPLLIMHERAAVS